MTTRQFLVVFLFVAVSSIALVARAHYLAPDVRRDATTWGFQDTTSSVTPNEEESTPSLIRTTRSALVAVLRENKLLADPGTPSRLTCFGCRTAFNVLDYFIRAGFGTSKIRGMTYEVCEKLNIMTARICKGVADLFTPEFIYIFSRVKVSGSQLCGLAFDPSCGEVNEDHWTVDIPPGKPPIPDEKDSRVSGKVLRIIQISDIHYDPLYQPGANAECEEPLCCRAYHGKSAMSAAGLYGSYEKCDIPKQTVESMLKYIASNVQYDYVFWTGDNSPHDIWNQTRASQIMLNRKLAVLVRKYLASKPIFPSIGNHEGNPVDSFPLPWVKGKESIAWLYEYLNATWPQMVERSLNDETIAKGGFYSIQVSPGYRVISINTNYCNTKNWWLFLNSTDPVDELHWLVGELWKAEKNKEKVHLIGHIPPPMNDCRPEWSRNFYNIINRFEGTVTAQFYGHTHFDEMQLYYNATGAGSRRAVSVSYVAPSVTTFRFLNPAFRVYLVDAQTYEILDHENYFLNLTEANYSGRAKWEKLYSAKDAYGLKSLRPASWADWIDRMDRDPSLFEKYYTFYHRKSPVFPPCDLSCKRQLICNIKQGKSFDNSFC